MMLKRASVYVIYAVCVAGACALLVAGVLAYFVVSLDTRNGGIQDGLGRHLEPIPYFVQALLPMSGDWPGFMWWAIDMVVFWGGLTFLYQLFQLSQRIKDSMPTPSGPTGMAEQSSSLDRKR